MDAEVGSSRVFSVLWRWIRRAVIAVALVVLAGSLPFAGQAQAEPKPSADVDRNRSVAVGKAKTRDGQVSESQVDLWKAPAVSWPSPGKAEVAIAGSGRVAVPGQPVRVGRPSSAPARAAVSPPRVPVPPSRSGG
ncbi:hypothetical protein [Couchioplanes caeruleus]|uniref:hypothetical protein n=1 Tax=Couchioplanes caeruleus TaxID=56438 RepID=UPI000B1816C6|nr:hypothetical protein [Couchioplanes caeruleus]